MQTALSFGALSEIPIDKFPRFQDCNAVSPRYFEEVFVAAYNTRSIARNRAGKKLVIIRIVATA